MDTARQTPQPSYPFDVRALAMEVAAHLRPATVRGRTFGEVCEAWLATASKRVEDTRNEARHVELLAPLAALLEIELTPKRVRAVLDSLLRPVGPLGPVTVNMLRAKGKRIVREAQLEEEWGALNPFDLAPRYKQCRPEHHRVTLEEARAVLPHLRRDMWRQAVLALLLGPRPGEVKALRREDINLQRGSITFRRSNKRNKTKTGRSRTLPIPEQLLPALVEALEVSSSALVFPEADGTLQRADKQWSRALRKAYAQAGLEVPPSLRWYDLRHAAATLLTEAGCMPAVVRKVLGHTPRDTTEGVYLHLSLDVMRRELERFQLFPRSLSLNVTTE